MAQDDSLEKRMGRFKQPNMCYLVSGLRNPVEVDAEATGTKPDLAEQVVGYFREKRVPFAPYVRKEFSNVDEGFANTLYHLTKECLAVAAKGAVAAAGVPSQFLRALEPYEKVYFLAGVYGTDKPPEKLEQMNAYEIASFYIRAGIDTMSHAYYSLKKARKRKGHVRLPYSKEIRKRLAKLAEIRKRIGEAGAKQRQLMLW